MKTSAGNGISRTSSAASSRLVPITSGSVETPDTGVTALTTAETPGGEPGSLVPGAVPSVPPGAATTTVVVVVLAGVVVEVVVVDVVVEQVVVAEEVVVGGGRVVVVVGGRVVVVVGGGGVFSRTPPRSLWVSRHPSTSPLSGS